MKERIEQALQPLNGLPLTDMWRPYGAHCFEFGEQRPAVNRRGEPVTVGEYRVSIECEWRVIAANRIILGETDYSAANEPEDETPVAGYEYPGEGEGPRHDRVKAFLQMLETNPPIVEAIVADELGSVYFTLSQGYRLEILPTTSLEGDHWRLYQPHKETPQFAVTGEGVKQRG